MLNKQINHSPECICIFVVVNVSMIYTENKHSSLSFSLCLPTVPSPPASPMRGSDEASHVKSILESVCQSEKIGREAINKLCRHVKADPQEEQVGGDMQELTLVSLAPNAKMGSVTVYSVMVAY